MVPGLILDIGAPVIAYYGLSALGASDFWALTAGGLVSGLRILYIVMKDRRLDGFAAVMLALFSFGILTAFFTGDARFVLMKDSVGSGIAGLIFLSTLLMRRPFIFYSARRFSASNEQARAQWDHKYETTPGFRRVMRNLTAIWGVGLLVESLLRVALVYALPVSTMVALSTVLQIACIALLIVITMRYVRVARRAAGAAAR